MYGRADNAGDWIYTDTDVKAIRAWMDCTIDPDQRAYSFSPVPQSASVRARLRSAIAPPRSG